jgi:hypothetical protein
LLPSLEGGVGWVAARAALASTYPGPSLPGGEKMSSMIGATLAFRANEEGTKKPAGFTHGLLSLTAAAKPRRRSGVARRQGFRRDAD